MCLDPIPTSSVPILSVVCNVQHVACSENIAQCATYPAHGVQSVSRMVCQVRSPYSAGCTVYSTRNVFSAQSVQCAECAK